MQQTTSHDLSSEMQACIIACNECAGICARCVSHCLGKGGAHAEPDHIARLLDCAQSCQLAVELMNRGSQMADRMCALCAEFCDRCAEDCERLAEGDEMMRQCADVCRRCAIACRAMAQ